MGEVALDNPMRRVRLLKVVVNSSIGEGAARLERASKIIEELTGQKPSIRRAKKTVKGFGIHKGEPIAVMVTVRKERAVEFLKRALSAVNYRIKESSIDEFGNVSFGIKEHLDIPGMRYNPELGIIGMDVTVHLGRSGHRVLYRSKMPRRIPRSHRLTREETVTYLREQFGVEVLPG
ncbi:MAG: 50S ribosomal protein L5 [Aigarchaeota archaeon]|nr:50S ribosomal protein L5 [Aigarchaeota archaeon]MDW8092208.1 50S ribosomal protein L5 [Nitrososphaerota archaeon]